MITEKTVNFEKLSQDWFKKEVELKVVDVPQLS